MIDKLYEYRFNIFITTQLIILFGSLLFPPEFFDNTLSPILFLINTSTGILLISKKKKLMWFLIALFAISLFVFGSSIFQRGVISHDNLLIQLSVYFLFHVIVAYQIVLQIWKAKRVNNTVVIGLMSGYISLGFVAFFIFSIIEIVAPGSFVGGMLDVNSNDTVRLDSIMYYAYITLLTIGYAEIVPATPVAQKAAILTGLMGQFYLVIVTAIVVGKYLINTEKPKDS